MTTKQTIQDEMSTADRINLLMQQAIDTRKETPDGTVVIRSHELSGKTVIVINDWILDNGAMVASSGKVVANS